MYGGFFIMEDNLKPVDTQRNRAERVTFLDYPEYHHMADFFGLGAEDRRDSKLAEKLSYLSDWGKQRAGTDDSLKIFMELKSAQRTLGTSVKGKELVNKLWEFARLDNDRKRIQDKMSLMMEDHV